MELACKTISHTFAFNSLQVLYKGEQIGQCPTSARRNEMETLEKTISHENSQHEAPFFETLYLYFYLAKILTVNDPQSLLDYAKLQDALT